MTQVKGEPRAKPIDPDVRAKAMKIYKKTGSVIQAARITGVKRPTILRWIRRDKDHVSLLIDQDKYLEDKGQIQYKDKVEAGIRSGYEKAVRRIVADHIEEEGLDLVQHMPERVTQSLTEIEERLLSVISLTIDEIETTLENGPRRMEPIAGYLGALVKCLGSAVEKHQLLSGKPTSREESTIDGRVTVTERMEHHFQRYMDVIEGKGIRIIDDDDNISDTPYGLHDGNGVGEPVDP